MKNKIYTVVIIIFSVLCGIISKDYFLGTIILLSGLLNAYYASIGKTYNYIFGAIFCLTNGYISYINGLYGIALWGIPVISGSLSLLPMVFNPIINLINDMYGIYNWKKLEKIQGGSHE